MKVVRQARLELSGGSTPDLLRPQRPDRRPLSPGALARPRASCPCATPDTTSRPIRILRSPAPPLSHTLRRHLHHPEH